MEFLSDYSGEKFKAVITDPPYMIGATSIGDPNSKNGSWADLTNAAFWYSAWMRLCFSHLQPNGYLICFLNWRSVPVITKAVADCGRRLDSLAVWHKRGAGPSGPRYLRPCYEMLAFCGMDQATIPDRSQVDYFEFHWQSNFGDSGHPAQKPVPLLCRLLELVTIEGDLVLDPFAGSGTTGIACAQKGRRFVGCELNPVWHTKATERINEAMNPLNELMEGKQ